MILSHTGPFIHHATKWHNHPPDNQLWLPTLIYSPLLQDARPKGEYSPFGRSRTNDTTYESTTTYREQAVRKSPD
jgi:hypothetical protein